MLMIEKKVRKNIRERERRRRKICVQKENRKT